MSLRAEEGLPYPYPEINSGTGKEGAPPPIYSKVDKGLCPFQINGPPS
jgi:hypothetical protein